jgi:hypothetical protein
MTARRLVLAGTAVVGLGLVATLQWHAGTACCNAPLPLPIAWERSDVARGLYTVRAEPGVLAFVTDGAILPGCRQVETRAWRDGGQVHLVSEVVAASEADCGWPSAQRWRHGRLPLPAGAYLLTWTLGGDTIVHGAIGIAPPP